MIHDLDQTVTNPHDSRIKGSTPEIVDQPVDILSLTLKSIGQRSRHRFQKKDTVRESGPIDHLDTLFYFLFRSSTCRSPGSSRLGIFKSSGDRDDYCPKLLAQI